MAKFRITAPDGNTYEITAPDDASEADVLAYAQQNYQSAPKAGPDFSDVQTKVTAGRGASIRPKIPRTQAELDRATGTTLDPTAGMSRFQQARAGFGKWAADSGQGIKQAVNSAQQVKAGLEGSLLLRAGLIDRPQFREYINRVGVPLYERGLEMQRETEANRVVDEPLMDRGAGLAGNVLGYATQLIGPGIALRGSTLGAALLPRTVAGNVLQGSVMGAAQPFASEDERLLNTGVGGVAGGVGAAIPAAAGGLARTMRYGRPSGVERRAGKTLREAMQGRPLNIEQSGVQGVNRTLGEASMDPGLMAIERNLRRTDPGSFVDIDAANNAARVAALQNIAGDEASMAAAVQARDAAAEQARQRAFSGANAFDSGRQAQIDAARAAEAESARYRMFGLEPPASAAPEAPASAKSGLVSNMATLAEGSAGRPSVQNVIRSVQGAIADAPDDVNGLYNARKYVTDLLEGKAGSDMQSARAATRELMQAKELIDSEISARVGGDLWQNYLGAYQQGSKPINRMQIGQELLSRGRAAQDDILGNPLLQPGRFGRAARNLDDIAQSATGFNKAKPGDYLTADDLKSIAAINDDLRRVSVRQANPAQPGSATYEAGSLAGRLAQRGALQMAGRALPMVGDTVKAYQEGMDKMLQEKLAFLVQNPKEAQRVLKALPPAQRGALTQAMMRLGSVSASGAAFSE